MKNIVTILLLLTVNFCCYSQDKLSAQRNFSLLKCGLYGNENGDVGFKTKFLIDDKGNTGIRFQTWGYLMEENLISQDGIVELKNVVDIESFEILNEFYCKDKNYVYSIFYTSSGATLNISKDIHAETFRAFKNSSYGIDKNGIYFRTGKLEMIDINQFTIIPDDPFGAYDGKNYYNYGEIISIEEATTRRYKVTD